MSSHPSQLLHRERLRQAGYKITHARLTVLQVIEALGSHVTSAQVLDGVNQVDSGIGRASVFRTLDLLTRLGIIRPTYLDSSSTPKYVLMPNGHHHHVICTRCHRVMEFDDCGLEAMTKALEARLHARIHGHLLEFYGECESCLNSGPPSDPNE
ncbi:MAG: transcriptional repressor [Anaerolineae bacterium]|nr:transcriptional repressor [Anaerolineae bacterium]MDW8170892.1 Fur family transcriptional regulator [Anaerolineae bacterium]